LPSRTISCILLSVLTWWSISTAQADSPDRDHFGASSITRHALRRVSAFHRRGHDGLMYGGGAYVPAMSDETIIVRRNGVLIFSAVRPLVKSAAREKWSAQKIWVHCRNWRHRSLCSGTMSMPLAICRYRHTLPNWRKICSLGRSVRLCRRVTRSRPARHRAPLMTLELRCNARLSLAWSMAVIS